MRNSHFITFLQESLGGCITGGRELTKVGGVTLIQDRDSEDLQSGREREWTHQRGT